MSPGFGLFMLTTTTLIGGAMLVMWIGELITEYGIGNGASLIIMSRHHRGHARPA